MRFNHVFFLLMLLSAASAFALPRRVTDERRPVFGALVLPVSWPTSRLLAKEDPRPRDELARENLDLRERNDELASALFRLTAENGQLRIAAAERNEVPELKDLLTPVHVAGTTLGSGDGLSLVGSTVSGLQPEMCAMYRREVVGRLVSGKAGTTLRLLTDPQSNVEAYFASYRKPGPGPTTGPAAAQDPDRPVLVRLDRLQTRVGFGAGDGRIVFRNVPMSDVRAAGLAAGDWALLQDRRFPEVLHHRRIGKVTAIRDAGNLMAEIEVRPEQDMKRVPKVMVLTKDR